MVQININGINRDMTAQEQAPAMAAVEQKQQEMMLNAENDAKQAPAG